MIKKSLLLLFCLFYVFSAPAQQLPNSSEESKKTEEDKDTKNGEKNKEKKDEPPHIGNFSLPPSQIPGPLVSFGQNIVDKGQLVVGSDARRTAGPKKDENELSPFVIYGITDKFSVALAQPFALRLHDGDAHSSGIEDTLVQLEYVYHTKNTKKYSDTATIVGNMTFPSGSSKKDPPTGFGSPSFFLGTTYNHIYPDWLFFGSPGVVLTTTHNGTKFGNEYLYQLGIGRNIAYKKDKWLFDVITEITGVYSEKNKINGVTDPNSGGNVIFVTPSLWFSTKKLILQLGVGFPVVQHLFGHQNKDNYLVRSEIRYSFK